MLAIRSSGDDPYLSTDVRIPPREDGESGLILQLRVRAHAAGAGQVFWATERAPSMTEARSSRFDLVHDGAWHEHSVFLPVDGTLTSLRLDPGGASGLVEVTELKLLEGQAHPLTIERLEITPGLARVVLGGAAVPGMTARIRVRNGGLAARAALIRARLGGDSGPGRAAPLSIPPGASVEASLPLRGLGLFEVVHIVLTSAGLPLRGRVASGGCPHNGELRIIALMEMSS